MLPQIIISDILSGKLTFFNFLNLSWKDGVTSIDLGELYDEILSFQNQSDDFWIDYEKVLVETITDLLKPL